MTGLERMFLTYKRLFTLIDAWTLRYCDQDGAIAVTRLVLVEALRQAARGWATENGPYAEIVEASLRYINMYSGPLKSAEGFWPLETVPPVDDEFLKDVAWLWSMVYEAVYLVDGYGRILEDLCHQIIVSDPRATTAESLEEKVYSRVGLHSTLGYVLQHIKDHEPDTMLVCAITGGIAAEETRKGLAWKRTFFSWPGGPL